VRRQIQLSPADRLLLELGRDYLAALWRFPCSDCWEEHEDQIHIYTLGAVYAGLNALGALLNDASASRSAEEIRAFVLENRVSGGRLIKSIGSEDVDANLLALAVPYNLLDCSHPLYQATIAQIQSDLMGPDGGMHRYAADTYYGGGEWVLLSAWLGWVAVESGNMSLAHRQLAWVESQAKAHGDLPEQVENQLYFPQEYPAWEKRWRPIATPLLWSHAMYLILWHKLHEREAR